jgi:predicted RNase H-like HicB family nuclease
MKVAEPWSVNLERGERWWYAHVAELPGCFTRGESRGEVLGELPKAISRHLGFLEAKGRASAAGTTEFDVVEEVEGVPELGESGGAVALFSSDCGPMEGEEFRSFLMGWNREELTALVGQLQDDAMNARPFQDKRTIGETLRHVANAEEWYVSRLGAEAQGVYEGFIECVRPGGRRLPVLGRLDLTRRGAVHALEKAFERGVPGVFTRAEYTGHPGERWTFRKVLRRFVEHEREHIGTINKVVEALGRAPEG